VASSRPASDHQCVVRHAAAACARRTLRFGPEVTRPNGGVVLTRAATQAASHQCLALEARQATGRPVPALRPHGR
jgi:hypothetical protein